MVEIRVSPERLRSVAGQLDSNRQEIDGVLQRMISMINDLQGEWTGLAQVDYANQFNERVPRTRTQLNEILENLAQEMRRIANTFEETDQNVI